MKMMKQHSLIIFIVCISYSWCVVYDIYEIGKELKEWYTIVDKIRLKKTLDARDMGELIENDDGTNGLIKNQMDKIYKLLNQMEKFMGRRTLFASLKLQPSENILVTASTDVALSLHVIEESFEHFWQYVNEENYHSNVELQTMTENLNLYMKTNMSNVRRVIADTNEFKPFHANIVEALSVRAVLLQPQICDSHQVFSSILINLLRAVMTAEIKTNLVSGFNNVYMTSESEGWETLNSIAIEKLEKKFVHYLSIFTAYISITESLYMRACEPNDGNWIRNKNFYELEGTIQTTIFKYRWGLCRYASCNDILFINPNRCEPEGYDPRTSCQGDERECAWLNGIKACVLETGPYRFQSVNSSELGPLGTNFRCPRNNGYIIDVGNDLTHAACACNCYGTRNKISLAIAGSEANRNKVITGVRFIRQNYILHIQVRQAKLGAYGQILQHAQTWVPLKRDLQSSEINQINGENRVFFLDDLQLLRDYVLTGVQFKREKRGNVTGFAIAITGMKFDYRSGKLEPEKKALVSSPPSKTGEGVPFTAINSALARWPHLPSSKNLTYIQLERSELPDDFGQATLPFFDGVPITANPAAPLGGIGIFHKGTDNYAGFISLRIFGIRYHHYFLDFLIRNLRNDRVSFNNSANNNHYRYT